MSKKKASKLTLEVLKYNALKLRANKQIPFELAYQISKLTKDSDKSWIKYLCIQSEHMLRVKGYYKKFPEVEKDYNNVILNDYIKYLGE